MGDLIETVLTLVREHPGINRQELVVKLGAPDVATRELTNCLTTLRRQGRIENQGTRKYPKWYAIEQSAPESNPKDELDDIIRRSEERLRRSLEHLAKHKLF